MTEGIRTVAIHRGETDKLLSRSERNQTAKEIQILAEKYGLSESECSAQVAGGKIIEHLMPSDYNECNLSPSIIDAALVMQQICRSSGWPTSLARLAVRSYLFLFVAYLLQLFILYMIATEEQVMDKFAGQMSLCNFGANVESCPHGKDCIGPSGTNYKDAGRMYDYGSWTTRTFFRDSLKSIFPELADEIKESIDPGEYGLENYWVRYVCVFIFMVSVMSDWRSTMSLASILYYVPTKAEPWLEYDVPDWASKAKVKEVLDLSEADFIKFKVAGMPLKWKIINLIVIVWPKLLIWAMTAKYGVVFLMETAGIEDVIVNVTALTFILNLDEMLFQNFSHKALHHVLDQIGPLIVKDPPPSSENHLQDSFERAESERHGSKLSFGLIPQRPILTLLMGIIFLFDYYYSHCEFSAIGGLVSQAVALPDYQVYPVHKFFSPFPDAAVKDPYWSPPK